MLDLRFSPDHSWVRRDDDGLATVGISPYAQEQLGDIVYIEAPDVGREITHGEDIGVIESVKTTGELKAPASGTVVALNAAALESPEQVNESPLDDGWIFRMRIDDEAALDELMDEDAYAEYVEGLD
ncbi:MAG: glycine cleavage system protein GcvH [Gammaproteobacteria bacterium]|nr:glycine cleavage system protein GcvH [Gammaproteobacteria bacterium]